MASDLSRLFLDATQRYALPDGYLARTAQIESGANPSARNPNSSAGGLFQFIDSTARQYGLQDRFDPAQATDAAARLARDNATVLQRALGRAPSAAELYLAHQQGAGGAAKLLSAPAANAASIVGPAAISLNGGGIDMSAADFARRWLDKFNRGANIAASSSVSPPAGAAPPSVSPPAGAALPPVSPPAGAALLPVSLPPVSLPALFVNTAQQQQQAEDEDRRARLSALFGPDPLQFVG